MIKSSDGITTKYLYPVGDGSVEVTHINQPEKHIICFSTQLGCVVGCTFCVSSHPTRFRRNLTVEEMLGQITEAGWKIRDDKPVLFSAMGEGEPLLNYDSVVKVLRYIGNFFTGADIEYAGGKEYKLALSTSGVSTIRIRQLAMVDFPAPFKLQISLHSMIRRDEMMPKVLDAHQVIKAGHDYQDISGRPVEWNVVLLDSVNDTRIDADVIAHALRPGDHVKLNRFNPFPGSPFVASDRAEEYVDVLKSYGLEVEDYVTDGSDIQAACGQLSWKAP